MAIIFNEIDLENYQNFNFSDPQHDLFVGTSEDDFIYGLMGNDELYGKGGNDFMVGDTAGYDLNGESFDVPSNVDEEGNILFNYWFIANNDTMYGGHGDDIMVGDNYLVESSGINSSDVRTLWGVDVMYGGKGNDIMHGSKGRANEIDMVAFANGEIVISDITLGVVGDGTDQFYIDLVYEGNYMKGGAGADIIGGISAGVFSLNAKDHSDLTYDNHETTASNSTFWDPEQQFAWQGGTVASLGGEFAEYEGYDDVLLGGRDNDIVVGEYGAQIYVVEDYAALHASNDLLPTAEYSMQDFYQDQVLTGQVDSNYGHDYIKGGDGDDMLFGETITRYLSVEDQSTVDGFVDIHGNDYILGGRGDDALYGDMKELIFNKDADATWANTIFVLGDDILDGGDGDDMLFGDYDHAHKQDNVFDDLIAAEADNNLFVHGNDTFVFKVSDGEDHDVIGDFGYGDDIIELYGYSDYELEIVGNDTVIHTADDSTITVLGVTDLSEEDIVLV